jgi:hypothetical protein
MSLDHHEAHVAAEARNVPEDAGLRTSISVALDDVGQRLDAPDLQRNQRMALLQRQAELGDLRDELALRDRRRAAERPPARR